MECSFTKLPYHQTGYFSKIIVDYLNESPYLKPFYKHPASLEGIMAAIKARQQFKTNRRLLVAELKKQYAQVNASVSVEKNIDSLADQNTFTICTAHQPSIFTGNFFFIYKILHAIKLADELNKEFPPYHFVPVFYMGSEDADLDELGTIYIDGDKLIWDTKQTGAVGRMQPKGLEKIIQRLEGEFGVLPHGKELIDLLKKCYLESPDIQTATFKLINTLFAEYGLVVLIPDNGNLKQIMQKIFEDDLFTQVPSSIVEKTTVQLSEHYKVQANPRDINLFYLKDNVRDRITKNRSEYRVQSSEWKFTDTTLEEELKEYPERFSPNVILRGLFQEMILPNLAFIGGGGELAYWLEFKDLFEHYHVPYPVLVLRNSFLIIEKKWKEKIDKLGLSIEEIFLPEHELLNKIVKRDSGLQLNLEAEEKKARELYEALRVVVQKVDRSLIQYINALEAKALNSLKELEKKLLKAEKRKFTDHERQLKTIKEKLFPKNGLQERLENFMPYYARWGKSFIDCIYTHSFPLEQTFCVLIEK